MIQHDSYRARCVPARSNVYHPQPVLNMSVTTDVASRADRPGTRNTFGIGIVGFFLIFSLAPGMASTDEKTLHGHVPAAVRLLVPIGAPPGSKRIDLAVGLPLRNQGQLKQFLQQLYDPASPNYRHYLTPEQFTQMFGPTEQDYQAVIQFAQTNKLAVTGIHPNRIVLDVSGTVSDIEKAFHITIRAYQHPTEARTFYAPDVEPSADSALPILNVRGLDNYSIPRPNLKIRPADITTGVAVNSGSGPHGSYRGSDFRAAYAPGVSLMGSGQAVGLVEFDGYYTNDIITYESQAGLPNVPLTNVLIDGFNGAPGTQNSEVALDIELTLAMAPGLSRIYVYEAPSDMPWVDLLSRMANDNFAKQLSCSWTGGDPDATAEQIFQQMAAQGQSFFAASGDFAAWTGAIEFPDDSPNITVVGGTTLSTTGPGGSWTSETVWNVYPSPDIYGFGSAGGVSTYYSIPSWQQGTNMTPSQGSNTYRNVPDVALTADNVYVVYNNGAADSFVGTSCAAPLWAGFIALANQQAAANGQPSVGFVNPAIYAIAKGPNYTSDFHDVTIGNNTWYLSPTRFYAVSGYDLCTGLGTPSGINLINDLVSLPTTPMLVNISARGSVETGDNVLISGFIVTGSDSKQVIIRALGPTLTSFGVPDALQDPVLQLHNATSMMMLNDDWQSAANASQIPMNYRSPDIRESALMTTLPPGSYTTVLSGKNTTASNGLLEVYSILSGLSNVSTRGFVGIGDHVLIGGFSSSGGNGSIQLIIRVLGPTLTQFGVNGALPDPTLALLDSNGNVLASNDNWKNTQQSTIQATGFAPPNDLEAAILAILPNGNYTAIVSGKNGTTGVALLEVYKVALATNK